MSLSSTRMKIQKSTRELRMRWDSSREQWNDSVSQRLEAEYIEPLERTVISVCEAMEAMNDVIARVQRDCE